MKVADEKSPNLVESPRVTIGMPLYNRADVLTRTLDALLTQSYPNIEICVSDNASTDDSAAICRLYCERDPRVRLNVNSENLGVIANFNIVRRMGGGKYFMWAGSDDHWEPTFLAELVAELESHPDACAAMSATKRMYDDGEALKPIRYTAPYDPNDMGPLRMVMAMLSSSTKIRKMKHGLYTCGLYRKDILDAIFDCCPAEESWGDRSLNAVAALSGRMRYVDKTLFTKTLHRKSFAERNPEDSFSKAKGNAEYLGKTIMIAKWILLSPTVPLHRKLYLPLLLAPRFLDICKAWMINGLITKGRSINKGDKTRN
ncbi:MAG: glycosyltransferase family 2 protein [Alphaproteobacteria bacterium]